jgi:CDP-diacylglycerol--glycerol-3-phosphate 3-phosphatidyltransferase
VNLANAIALVRALAVIPVVTLLAMHQDVAAAALFGLAALTDVLDGAVARARNEVTALGAALDPLADKILIVGTLAGLTLRGLVPPAALVVIIVREIAAIWLRSHSRVVLPATADAKLKTLAQVLAALGLLSAVITRSPTLTLAANGMLALAIALTIASGLKLMHRAAQTAAHAR